MYSITEEGRSTLLQKVSFGSTEIGCTEVLERPFATYLLVLMKDRTLVCLRMSGTMFAVDSVFPVFAHAVGDSLPILSCHGDTLLLSGSRALLVNRVTVMEASSD